MENVAQVLENELFITNIEYVGIDAPSGVALLKI